MMIPPAASTNSCFSRGGTQGLSIYGVSENVVSSNIDIQATNSATDEHSSSGSFLYNLSVLKDKVHQVQSLASMFISSDHSQPPESMAMAMASIGTLIQEIIITASSIMFTFQQISHGFGGSTGSGNNHSTNTNQLHHHHHHHHHHNPYEHSRFKLPEAEGQVVHQQNGDSNGVSYFGEEKEQGFYSSNDALDWYGDDSFNNCNSNDHNNTRTGSVTISKHNEVGREGLLAQKSENSEGLEKFSPKNYDVVEINVADILAKYTHYCAVCGKGFKRDANLRMHMRAHGDEYKSSAALSNPLKNNLVGNGKQDQGLPRLPRKFSCPQEGCRWNKKHAKFQPLKSMICVKNHYKRSHCPKLYVCKRCNRKQFSVLSDLRTHEKHCGDLKWQCSCGTTFSRKDKLMGHLALFLGHTPAMSSLAKMGKADQNAGQMQLDA